MFTPDLAGTRWEEQIKADLQQVMDQGQTSPGSTPTRGSPTWNVTLRRNSLRPHAGTDTRLRFKFLE